MSFLIVLLNLVPKNLVSYITGFLARLELPRSLQRPLNIAFIRAVGIDESEAAVDLKEEPSLEAIFIRKLRPGVRTISSPLCSPCDGTLGQTGPVISDDKALQVKGIEYSLSELIALPNRGFGSFSTIYLAPQNYHRVHSPVTGVLKSIKYVPGKLWPVNAMAVRAVPQLFSVNERMIFSIEVPAKGMLYLVMVGALNVGRIATPYWPDFVANSFSRQFNPMASKEISLNISLLAGAELGVFMLGSTVVLAFDKSLSSVYPLPSFTGTQKICLGEPLCK